MPNLLDRWASLGVGISGAAINTVEIPESLLIESLHSKNEHGRLYDAMATWLWSYGHLLINKKLHFKNSRDRRFFCALIEKIGRHEDKFKTLLAKKYKGAPEFLENDLLDSQKLWAKRHSDPIFMKYGFIVKENEWVREKILYSPKQTYQRSIILKYRALYGATIRSDFLALFPKDEALSLREISRRMQLAPASLQPIVQEYIKSGLIIPTHKSGPLAQLKWNPDFNIQAA